ncbi:putative peptidase C1-like protein F26E4.3 [Portunus trituberculatus]|uniref:Putative peptidase C1-like protein F26E4.3 n=1 Tax=Portunus trituberculatus TaxID=210409 RepID=A0A5B7JB36_PORTR|nr:putative peptidase C1-like protein F26E4.3 [Portunus trituberculatus]
MCQNGRLDCEDDACLVDEEVVSQVNSNPRRYGWTATNYSEFWGRKAKEGMVLRTGTLNPEALHYFPKAAVVQWNHACFGVSKRTGSNPVHGPSAVDEDVPDPAATGPTPHPEAVRRAVQAGMARKDQQGARPGLVRRLLGFLYPGSRARQVS